MSTLRNVGTQRSTLKITMKKKTLRLYQKIAFRICDVRICSVIWEPSNRSLPIFHWCTITHQYTDLQSYLDFHKMQDVPGFRLAGII